MQAINNELYTRLLLIRHGQTQHNTQGFISGRSDIPINETGHQQASIMAKRVKMEYAVDVLYASPLQRTMQTAQYLSQELGLPVIPHPDLIEYGFGELSDISESILEKSNPALFKQVRDWKEADFSVHHQRPSVADMEPIEEFKNRIQAFTDMILKNHRGKTVAAVSHGGFIKSFLYYHAGGDFSQYVPFWVDNVSLSIVDFYRGNPVIRLFNDNSHIHEDLELGSPRLL